MEVQETRIWKTCPSCELVFPSVCIRCPNCDVNLTVRRVFTCMKCGDIVDYNARYNHEAYHISLDKALEEIKRIEDQTEFIGTAWCDVCRVFLDEGDIMRSESDVPSCGTCMTVVTVDLATDCPVCYNPISRETFGQHMLIHWKDGEWKSVYDQSG